MPVPGLISASAFVCERILNEADGVNSAIRIVDVFFVPSLPPDIPVEKAPILLCVMVITKFDPSDDSQHTVDLKLVRPDGETKALGEPKTAKVLSKYSGLPGGFNLAVQIGLAPKQLGTHYIVVSIDGEVVGKAPFTLLQPDQETTA